MSYENDDDRVTRGVGAIAAADKVSPGRYRRRIESGIATRKRDRAMAAVANGALSGVSIARASLSHGSNPPIHPVIIKDRDHRSTVKAPPDPNAPPPAAAPLLRSVSGVPNAVHRATIFVQPTSSAPVVASVAVPLIAVLPPTAVAPTSSGAGPATGTGPSTQGAITRQAVSAIFDPIPNAPNAPIVETDNTTRNLAIAGGAVLAAYLLFFRKPA